MTPKVPSIVSSYQIIKKLENSIIGGKKGYQKLNAEAVLSNLKERKKSTHLIGTSRKRGVRLEQRTCQSFVHFVGLVCSE